MKLKFCPAPAAVVIVGGVVVASAFCQLMTQLKLLALLAAVDGGITGSRHWKERPNSPVRSPPNPVRIDHERLGDARHYHVQCGTTPAICPVRRPGANRE